MSYYPVTQLQYLEWGTTNSWNIINISYSLLIINIHITLNLSRHIFHKSCKDIIWWFKTCIEWKNLTNFYPVALLTTEWVQLKPTIMKLKIPSVEPPAIPCYFQSVWSLWISWIYYKENIPSIFWMMCFRTPKGQQVVIQWLSLKMN